jgi:HD-GYP domain-containing protein (c-di-GMP phosphodiesterase class II)
MTTSRPYSSPITAEEAIAELFRCTGSQFDPAVTEAFIAIIFEIASQDSPAGTPNDPLAIAA